LRHHRQIKLRCDLLRSELVVQDVDFINQICKLIHSHELVHSRHTVLPRILHVNRLGGIFQSSKNYITLFTPQPLLPKGMAVELAEEGQEVVFKSHFNSFMKCLSLLVLEVLVDRESHEAFQKLETD